MVHNGFECIDINKIRNIIENSETEKTIVVDVSIFKDLSRKVLEDVQYSREFRKIIRELEETFSQILSLKNETNKIPPELENKFINEYSALLRDIDRQFKLKKKIEDILRDIFKGYKILAPAYRVNINLYISRSISRGQFPDIQRGIIHYLINEIYYNSNLPISIVNAGSLDIANGQFVIISTNLIYLKNKEVGKIDFSSIKEKKQELKQKICTPKGEAICNIIRLLAEILGDKVIMGVDMGNIKYILEAIHIIFLFDP